MDELIKLKFWTDFLGLVRRHCSYIESNHVIDILTIAEHATHVPHAGNGPDLYDKIISLILLCCFVCSVIVVYGSLGGK